MNKFYSFLLLSFLTIFILIGCAATRKAEAARILKDCSSEFQTLELDSISLNPDLFKKTKGKILTALPNPKIVTLVKDISQGIIPDSLGILYFSMKFSVKNASKDTLWLRSVLGSVTIDSSLILPLSLNKEITLTPGNTEISMNSQLEINSKVLKLLTVDSLKINGEIQSSLSPTGEIISFQVNKTEHLTTEDKQALQDYSKKAILDALIDSWTSAFK